MAKNANKAPAGYTKLTARDVRKFDQRARDLIFEAQEYGWTFRISSRGHAIGRAPDGRSTFSVSDTVDSKHGGSRIMRREFERWKKDQDTTKLQAAKATRAAANTIIANLARHVIDDYTANGPDDAPESVKVVLRRMADDDDVATYMADRIAMRRPAPMILTNDLDNGSGNITEKSKPWRIQWVMADPDSHKVIGFGGPKMTADAAEAAVIEHLAGEARAKAEAKQAAIDAATPTPKPTPRAVDTTKMETFMKMYPCPHEGCEAVFEKQQSLGAHTLTVHQTKATCPWCSREFNKAALRTHEPACEKNPSHNDTFECGRCMGVFKVTGQGRHEGVCKKQTSAEIAAKRELNMRKRGLAAPVTVQPPSTTPAEREVKLAQLVAAAPGPIVTVPDMPPTAPTPPVADTHLSRLAASLPQIADPLSALMNLLAEVEELRSQRPEDLRAQIEVLTTERDEAIKRAEEAEGKLATLKSVFG